MYYMLPAEQAGSCVRESMSSKSDFLGYKFGLSPWTSFLTSPGLLSPSIKPSKVGSKD